MNELMDFQWLRQYTIPEERLLWKGRPGSGNLLTPSDVFLIPFSLLWCGFAIFWESSVIASGAPFFFALFGVPFVLVGLYIVLGRFIHRRWLLQHTEYAITDRCIYIKSGRSVNMLMAHSLPPMTVEQNRDGTATIRFDQPGYGRYSRGQRGTFGSPNGAYALESLSDLRSVQAAIAQMSK